MAKKSVLNSVRKASPRASRKQPAQKLYTSSINRHASGTRKDVVR